MPTAEKNNPSRWWACSVCLNADLPNGPDSNSLAFCCMCGKTRIAIQVDHFDVTEITATDPADCSLALQRGQHVTN